MATLTHPMARRTGHQTPRGKQDFNRDFGSDYRRAVGDYIVEKRLARGLTQLQLARMLGLRDTAISAIELGRNSLPPERADEMAEALGLNKRQFGKFLLRYTNPWLYAMIWPSELPRDAVGQIPERVSDQRLEEHDQGFGPSAAND